MFVPTVYPREVREEARRLRREQQLSLDSLVELLGIGRSTIYRWVSDLPIEGSGPGGGFSRDDAQRGTQSMLRNRRQGRDAAYARGLETFALFQDTPRFRDFVAAYIAHGYRQDPRRVSYSHSDPSLVRLVHYWIRTMGGNTIRYELQLVPGRDHASPQRFWAAHLGIEADSIKRVVTRENRSVRPPKKSSSPGTRAGVQVKSRPIGTLKMITTDTQLRAEIQAWMDCARAEW